MTIFNFSYGDPVRITRTKLTGTILRADGKTAVVLINGEHKRAVRYELTRIRHTESIGMLTLRMCKKKIGELRNKIKYILK
jgi:hypothetical protein